MKLPLSLTAEQSLALPKAKSLGQKYLTYHPNGWGGPRLGRYFPSRCQSLKVIRWGVPKPSRRPLTHGSILGRSAISSGGILRRNVTLLCHGPTLLTCAARQSRQLFEVLRTCRSRGLHSRV